MPLAFYPPMNDLKSRSMYSGEVQRQLRDKEESHLPQHRTTYELVPKSAQLSRESLKRGSTAIRTEAQAPMISTADGLMRASKSRASTWPVVDQSQVMLSGGMSQAFHPRLEERTSVSMYHGGMQTQFQDKDKEESKLQTRHTTVEPVVPTVQPSQASKRRSSTAVQTGVPV